jgi:hypothetical protein
LIQLRWGQTRLAFIVCQSTQKAHKFIGTTAVGKTPFGKKTFGKKPIMTFGKTTFGKKTLW